MFSCCSFSTTFQYSREQLTWDATQNVFEGIGVYTSCQIGITSEDVGGADVY